MIHQVFFYFIEYYCWEFTYRVVYGKDFSTQGTKLIIPTMNRYGKDGKSIHGT